MRCGKTAKAYREGNITAAFGTDLFLQGVTSIPNLLLRFYTSLGITDEEMMLLIQLLRLRVEEKVLYPAPKVLAECLNGGVDRVERNIASLLEKGVLAVTEYYDETQNVILNGYDFEPLLEKLSEIWACAKVKEIEQTRRMLEEQDSIKKVTDATFGQLVKTFEGEFGRPLSPIEVEQIKKWADETDYRLIIDALRRAVLMGKHNFRYIDSILLEWHKNNLKTVEAVNEYEHQFKKQRKRQPVRKEKRIDEQKKALIKTLYMS